MLNQHLQNPKIEKSDGEEHDLVTAFILLVFILVISPISLYLNYNPTLFFIGISLGFLLTPDLDQSVQVIACRNFGRLLGLPFFLIRYIAGNKRTTIVESFFSGVWLGIWSPYSAVMPHRGISHMPFVGTLTRWIYLSAWLGLFSFFVGDVDSTLEVVRESFLEIFLLFIGNSIADIGHYLRDYYGISINTFL